MLEVTQAAAVQLAEARQSQGLPETVGIRIFGESRPEGEVGVGLAFAEVPAGDDQVTEKDGTRVFVAPEVAEALASSALDVQETPEGARLVLTPKEDVEGI